MLNNAAPAVQFRRDKRWRNWSGTQSCRPAVTYYPRTLDDLVEVVRQARQSGHRVRAAGRGHSQGPLSVTDGSLVAVGGLNRIGPVDVARREVTVEAGVTVGALDRVLRRHGLAVPTNVVLTSVQYGGVVATGSHGAGWDSQTLSDLVVAMTVVMHDGSVVRFSEATHGPDVMNAVRCCLGTIGLIYQITLRVEPMTSQVASDRRLPLAAAEDPAQLAILLTGNEYTEVFWFPAARGLWFKSWNRTAAPARPVPPIRVPRELVTTMAGRLAGRQAIRVSGLTSTVNNLILHSVVPRNRSAVVDMADATHYRHFIELLPVEIMSFAVKIDPGFTSVQRAWSVVVEKVRERAARTGEYPLNLVLEMRPIRSSRALLSPAFGAEGEHHCYFELISYTRTPGCHAFFDEVALAWMDMPELHARPHWGKYFYDVPGVVPYIRDVWGDNLTTFAKIRDGLDPGRLFLNPELERIFYRDD